MTLSCKKSCKQFPKNIQKYKSQIKKLFSKYLKDLNIPVKADVLTLKNADVLTLKNLTTVIKTLRWIFRKHAENSEAHSKYNWYST